MYNKDHGYTRFRQPRKSLNEPNKVGTTLKSTQVNFGFRQANLTWHYIGSAHDKIDAWNQVTPESFWATATVDLSTSSVLSRS